VSETPAVRCPRCGSGVENFRPGWTTPLLTCRWCVWMNWFRFVEHEMRRAVDEAERIARDAA
jgi:hypothetical protein